MSDEEIKQLITIDPSSGMPIYAQIRTRIAYLIISGMLKEGDKLPTVRDLAVSLGVNYNTVNRAYMDLEKDKYLVSMRRRGTFVSKPLREVCEQDDVRDTVNSLVRDLIKQCDELGVPRRVLLEIIRTHLDSSHLS